MKKNRHIQPKKTNQKQTQNNYNSDQKKKNYPVKCPLLEFLVYE